MNKQEIQQQALTNAVAGTSTANYDSIFAGFLDKGISEEDILPRENVFTFNAWKALGRVVKKGEKGVRVITWIPVEKVDKETGEKEVFSKKKTTTVFHVSQTTEISEEG
jgi:antirestriction protein ArdC